MTAARVNSSGTDNVWGTIRLLPTFWPKLTHPAVRRRQLTYLFKSEVGYGLNIAQ